MNSTTKQNLDKKWVTLFYEANIPFKMIYKLSSYHAIWIKLLKSSKEDLSRLVINRSKSSIHKHGVTICSDGWDNINSCPLLNIVLICPNKDLFLGAIDTIKD